MDYRKIALDLARHFHELKGQELFDIRGIAHALARIPRANGWFESTYYVGEHCLIVCDAVTNPAEKLAALLHDAPEAYVGDCVRPLKYCPGMEPFREIEHAIAEALAFHFGTQWPLPDSVEVADKAAWATDKNFINSKTRRFMTSEEVEAAFLKKFEELHCA